PETLPLVFELFTQVERSLDRSQGGLGIGLALVQRLTELHGGRVEAASVLGTGSEFVVRLPMIRQETIGGAQDEPAFPLALCERPLRVLVVDDNEDSAVSLSLLLTALGHQVETNFDGHTAVQTSREFVPQVVLLDIGLPGLDGYEVAQQIRQQPGMAAAMIIAVTGYGQEEDRQRSREALFDHHFTKPADFAELMGILATTAG
ncbi:MAG TPA: response regulator, partial [bacterium]|nr:response regulator [bacterium]